MCLAVWAFILVALSFLVVGNQYLSPVALITAFIGEKIQPLTSNCFDTY